MRFFALSLLLLMACLSCTPRYAVLQASGEFSEDGISFTIPTGWHITDIETTTGVAHHVLCKRQGWRSTGEFTINWVDAPISPEEQLAIYKDTFEQNMFMKAGKIEFSTPQSARLHGRDALRMSYTYKVLGTRYSGEIYAFSCGNRAITFILEQATGGSQQNKAGFESIARTFQCEYGTRI